MVIVLSDHNCLGQARQLFLVVNQPEYAEIEVELKSFDDVGLPKEADDETVWKFCQDNGVLLLTGNRSGADGEMSLEAVVRHHYTPEILPVLTISNLKRVIPDKDYCERCALKLLEFVIDMVDEDKYLGVTRLYLP